MKRPYLSDDEISELVPLIDGAIEFERINGRPHGMRARTLYRLIGKLIPDAEAAKAEAELERVRQAKTKRQARGGRK